MNARERTLAITAGGAVAVGAMWVLVLDPMLGRFGELGEKTRAQEATLVHERELRDAEPRLKRERAALDLRLLPAGQSAVPLFLTHVRGLTREAGFEPSTLRLLASRPLTSDEPRAPVARGATPPPSPFNELSFELQARTSLAKLQAFLVRLAASDHPLRVVALSLAPRPGGTDLDANLSLVALAPREAK